MLTRKYGVITNKGEVITREGEVPELKDNQVLIKVHASLISPGTEMGGVKGRRENPDPEQDDVAFGYANAGEIIEVKGSCSDLEPGMRVTAMGGGYAQHANYACVPVNLVVPIPDDVTYSQAAYACLGATALQSVRRTVPQLGEYGVILGLGIVGNLTSQLSQLSGARIIAWEGYNSRIEIAKQCGINTIANFKEVDSVETTKEFTKPYGADFAIIAFGGNADDAFNSVKGCMKVSADTHVMGRIVLVGGCQINVVGGAGLGNLDIRASSRTGPGYHDEAYEYGRDYPDAFVQFTTQRNLKEIITLISEKRLLVDPMCTHQIKLEDISEAAELLIEHPDQAMGIILEMSH